MKRLRYPALTLALAVAGLAACGNGPVPPFGPEIIGNPAPDDLDGDGFIAGEDCDDEDPAVFPGAEEICSDGIDNDCNGDIDLDDDACLIDEDDDGYVAAKDCDDNNAAIHPEATEICDGLDNDCNGIIDDVPEADIAVLECEPPPPDSDQDGYAADVDCDDNNAAVYPGALEICDGLDNDCNDIIDDVGDSDFRVVNCEDLPPDNDQDGYPADVDCDDNDAAINPDALEVCDDDVDNDCNGLLDWDDIDCELIGNG